MKKSLFILHNQNLQQSYIDSIYYTVPDDFMTLVSALSGLVHVVLCVKCVTIEGITSLVRNSPQLITLNIRLYDVQDRYNHWVLQHYGTQFGELRKEFYYRKLLTDCQYSVEKMKIRRSSFPYDMDPLIQQDPLLSELFCTANVKYN